jgi:hypothetical protein
VSALRLRAASQDRRQRHVLVGFMPGLCAPISDGRGDGTTARLRTALSRICACVHQKGSMIKHDAPKASRRSVLFVIFAHAKEHCLQ